MLLSLREANKPNNVLKTFLKEHFVNVFKKHDIVVLTRMREISLENMKYNFFFRIDINPLRNRVDRPSTKLSLVWTNKTRIYQLVF